MNSIKFTQTFMQEGRIANFCNTGPSFTVPTSEKKNFPNSFFTNPHPSWCSNKLIFRKSSPHILHILTATCLLKAHFSHQSVLLHYGQSWFDACHGQVFFPSSLRPDQLCIFPNLYPVFRVMKTDAKRSERKLGHHNLRLEQERWKLHIKCPFHSIWFISFCKCFCFAFI